MAKQHEGTNEQEQFDEHTNAKFTYLVSYCNKIGSLKELAKKCLVPFNDFYFFMRSLRGQSSLSVYNAGNLHTSLLYTFLIEKNIYRSNFFYGKNSIVINRNKLVHFYPSYYSLQYKLISNTPTEDIINTTELEQLNQLDNEEDPSTTSKDCNTQIEKRPPITILSTCLDLSITSSDDKSTISLYNIMIEHLKYRPPSSQETSYYKLMVANHEVNILRKDILQTDYLSILRGGMLQEDQLESYIKQYIKSLKDKHAKQIPS